MDLLFDPVFEDVQQLSIVKKQNEVEKAISNFNSEAAYVALFTTLWNTGLPCFDSKERAKKYGRIKCTFNIFN